MINNYIEKKQIETSSYILYAPDTLKEIATKMIENLNNKLPEILKIFNLKQSRKIQINLFDDNEKFRNFIYEIRGENKSLPLYAKGTYDKGMINAYVDNNIVINSEKYNKKICMCTHELFHILYLEIMLNNDLSKRVTWFDEGMALYMSGEKDNLKTLDIFKGFCANVFENTKEIPNLNELKHGTSFVNDKYNAYDLSYIAIRYLFDTMSTEEISTLLKNHEKVKNIGENIVKKAFKYYLNR